jgi:hypothetical protein
MISDSMETATIKQCFEMARRAAVQLQIATIDAHRILSRSEKLNAPTTATLQMIWRYGLCVEDLLVSVAEEHAIKLVRSY